MAFEDAVCRTLGILRLPLPTAWCSETTQFAKSALEKCNATCPKLYHGTFLPTRLLDVDGAELGDVKLVITRALNTSSVRYAALSYCWGTEGEAKTQLKTEDSSITKRLHNIPWKLLTRVIQDAATVCRSLAIRYLWVDSLCIIQNQDRGQPDSSTRVATDWDRENPKMGNIFSNAFVTVCASNSLSCHQSFLQRSLIQADLDITDDTLNTSQIRNRTFMACTGTGDFCKERVHGQAAVDR